ncbi:MAG: HAMP domain-containing histidine kinase [Flavobacteriales bacterium]|nr:HAMP domain-containing histidine kinase [Flavobacteriales bacterium]
MSFRLRMAVVFTLLVGALLALFGVLVLRHAEHLREEEFFDRLEDRAVLVERLIEEGRSMTVNEAGHLAQALRDALPEESIVVIGTDDRVLFAREPIELPVSWRETATRQGRVRVTQGERQFVLVDRPETRPMGILYTMASAIDATGLASLDELRRSMWLTGLVALLLTAGMAWLYATWALVPVRLLVRKAAEIHEPSERIPVPPGRKGDELASVASTFNELLARIDAAFNVQRSFIANASHELRTPLTILRGEAHQARQALRGAQAEAHLRAIEEQAMVMQDLLEQLLWLAQTRGAAERIPFTEVRLDEVAERALERCRARYPERPVRFTMDPDPEGTEPLVRGNAVLLTAALYNLLTNAVKYGGERIELRIALQGQEALVIVTDHGKGIAPEALASVRELFYRTADAAPLEGHGIGLALVDRIMQVHHGRLELSAVEGKGTVAVVRLPMPL